VLYYLSEWVGLGLLNLDPDHFRVINEVDAGLLRWITLTHLLVRVLQRHDSVINTETFLEAELIRQGEEIIVCPTEEAVEPYCDVFGKLQMLSLILSNGDKVGTVAQDVSRHEYWVGVETESSPLVTLPSLLFLKLNHLVEPAKWSQAG
jgi:hypothetical protein